MNKYKIISALLFTILFFNNAYSQSADEIVSKYINAIGGIENIQAIKSMKISGKLTAGLMEVMFTQVLKRPMMVLMEARLQEITTIQAFDGIQGWMINPFSGNEAPAIVPKDVEKSIRRNADFEGLLINYKLKGSTIELIGKEMFNDAKVYNIKLTDKEGDISNFYIDTASYVLQKEVSKITIEKKDIISESVFYNYKNVEGVMMPYSFEQKISDSPLGKQVITINKIEINIPVDNSYFNMPKD